MFKAAKRLGRLSLIAFGLSASLASGAANFCGQVDFRTVANSDLQNLVLLNDLAANTPSPRAQCGLPGENLAICSACENEIPEASMQILRPVLGETSHLRWHAKWHGVRVAADNVSTELFPKLQAAGLAPGDMRRDDFFQKYAVGGQLAGENFFYMHRMMIKMVQFELAMNHRACIAPWTELPAIGDRIWPLPRGPQSSEERAQDILRRQRLQNLVLKYQNEDFLRKVSLNQLGAVLEPTLHQGLHEFYRSSDLCSAEGKAQGFCDDLLPVETSPLNRHFWKIHGLVDDLLGRWLKVHGKTEISLQCGGRPDCYEWTATWVGKYPTPPTR